MAIRLFENTDLSLLILNYELNGGVAEFARVNRRTAELARTYFANQVVLLYTTRGDGLFTLFRPSHQRRCQRALDSGIVKTMDDAVRREYKLFLESMSNVYNFVGKGFRIDLGWLVPRPSELSFSAFSDCFPITRIKYRRSFDYRGGRAEWLGRALENMDPDLMKQLNFDLSEEEIITALETLSMRDNYGQNNLLDMLLERAIPENNLEKVFSNAAEYGRSNLLRLLNHPVCSEDLRGIALIKIAAIEGSLEEQMQWINELRNRGVTKRSRGMAVGVAANNGNLQVVELLLAPLHPIDSDYVDRGIHPDDLDSAMRLAAQQGYVEIFQRLHAYVYNNGKKGSGVEAGEYIVIIAEQLNKQGGMYWNAADKMIRSLLIDRSCCIRFIQRDIALEIIAKVGHSDIFVSLINANCTDALSDKHTINLINIILELKRASALMKKADQSMLEVLVARLSPKARSKLQLQHISSDNQFFLELLFDPASLTLEERGEVCRRRVFSHSSRIYRNADYLLIKMLKAGTAREDRAGAVRYAAAHGDIGNLIELLNPAFGGISEEERTDALVQANSVTREILEEYIPPLIDNLSNEKKE